MTTKTWKLVFAISAIWLLVFGCGSPATSSPVEFVESSTAPSLDKESDPFILLVDVTEGGTLSLNKIETGTIADPAGLSRKIRVIFEDRERAGVAARQITIYPQGKIKGEELEKLIEAVSTTGAAPIKIIKNGD